MGRIFNIITALVMNSDLISICLNTHVMDIHICRRQACCVRSIKIIIINKILKIACYHNQFHHCMSTIAIITA